MKENGKICIYPCEVLKFNILLFKLNIHKKIQNGSRFFVTLSILNLIRFFKVVVLDLIIFAFKIRKNKKFYIIVLFLALKIFNESRIYQNQFLTGIYLKYYNRIILHIAYKFTKLFMLIICTYVYKFWIFL